MTWSNVTTIQIGIGAKSNWQGLLNSNAIVAQTGHTSSAAKYCLDLTSNGQNDWYLPSTSELNLLYNNRFNLNYTLSTINGADQIDIGHWSSTEKDANYAYQYGGGPNGITCIQMGQKTELKLVRAIRKF